MTDQPTTREKILRGLLAKYGSKDSANIFFEVEEACCDQMKEDDAFMKDYPYNEGEDGWEEIYLYGGINSEYERQWEEGYFGSSLLVSGISFKKALDKVKGNKIRLRINCPGGMTKEGSVMASLITEAVAAGKEVVAMVDGIAASAALWPMLACSRVLGFEVSEYLVHRSWQGTYGNMHDHKAAAEALEELDNACFEFMGRRVKGGADKIRELADKRGDGTWLTSGKALEVGLIDEIVRASVPAAGNPDAGAKEDNAKPTEMKMRKEDLRAALELTLGKNPGLSVEEAFNEAVELRGEFAEDGTITVRFSPKAAKKADENTSDPAAKKTAGQETDEDWQLAARFAMLKMQQG